MTLGNVLLPKVAAAWRQRHPNCPLQVTVANGGTLRQKLRDGELDAAVIECPVSDEALVCRTFRRDRLVLVLPEGHPLTAQADSCESTVGSSKVRIDFSNNSLIV